MDIETWYQGCVGKGSNSHWFKMFQKYRRNLSSNWIFPGLHKKHNGDFDIWLLLFFVALKHAILGIVEMFI